LKIKELFEPISFCVEQKTTHVETLNSDVSFFQC
jgi:hypothetical protein